MVENLIKNKIPGGTLVFLSEGEEMHFTETEIADYVVAGCTPAEYRSSNIKQIE